MKFSIYLNRRGFVMFSLENDPFSQICSDTLILPTVTTVWTVTDFFFFLFFFFLFAFCFWTYKYTMIYAMRKKSVFGPHSINEIPDQPVYMYWIFCSLSMLYTISFGSVSGQRRSWSDCVNARVHFYKIRHTLLCIMYKINGQQIVIA